MMERLSLEQLVGIVKEQRVPVAVHSGKVETGGVFVILPPSLPPHRVHEAPGSEQFLSDALAAGAAYVVAGKDHAALLDGYAESKAKAVVCDAPRKALGRLAAAYYGTDVACPYVGGITGTNGKTTETYLLEHLFRGLGQKVGIIGTVEYRWPGTTVPAPLTTPGCLELHSMLAQMRDAGVDRVFMEVSSHALDQERVAGIPYNAALFTNLTQDHLDYHAGMEDYFDAKARLFRPLSVGGLPFDDKVGAVNTDDAFGRKLLEENSDIVGFGIREQGAKGTRYLRGRVLSMSPSGMRLAMEYEGKEWSIDSRLVGGFNAMNLLGAQALGLAMGLDIDTFALFSNFTGVPGRLERIENPRRLHAFVDYAHTPDALVKAQAALREAGFKRLVTVFGCGGNRDRAKRPLMGEAVAASSDVAVLTSDNPRHEDPLSIMADVRPGLAACKEVHEQADRRQALKEAIAMLGPDDALLVAGKGHETYQQIGDEKKPFSDQEILREYLS